MKTCGMCSTEKPHSEFHKDRRGKNGLSAYCKACNISRSRKWRDDNPEGGKDSDLRSKFKLSLGRYKEILDAQGGVCTICGEADKSGRALAVDHDHACCPGKKSCGKCVRSLLCMNCNRGLGHFRDNVDVMRSAIDYIESHR